MKIAVGAKSDTLDSPVEPRFGRCRYFALVDLDTEAFEAVANPYQDTVGGAGTQSAQLVVEREVGAVLAGSYGPKATAVLADAGIDMVSGVSGTVREAVEQFKRGHRVAHVASVPPAGGPGRGFGSGRGRGRGGGRGGLGSGRGGGCGGRGPGGGRGPQGGLSAR